MALPTILTSGNLVPKNLSQQSSGRWLADYGDPVVLSFDVFSSGNSSSFVAVHISWGDGNTTVTPLSVPVLQTQQYMHDYEGEGDYTISVKVVNTDDEESATQIIPIQVAQKRPAQAHSARYSALALPTKRLRESLTAVTDFYAPESTALAAPASAGDTTIFVEGRGSQFVATSVITIKQPGKLISSARVLETNVNEITLDRALKADYDIEDTEVIISQKSLTQSSTSRIVQESGWFFPASIDSELIRSAISLIISTAPYERPMRRGWGSEVFEIPFDQLDAITEEILKAAVSEVIRAYEPRVTVLNVAIETGWENQYIKILVTLREKSNFNSVPFTLDFNLYNPASS